MNTKSTTIHPALIKTIALLALSTPSSAEEFEDFRYSVAGGSVTITGYPWDATGDVTIPDSIEGKPVTRIASNAFNRCTGLTSITIPEGVESIEGAGWYSFSIFADWPGAFYGCTSLTSFTLPSTLTDFGTGSLEGCSNLESILVHPDNPAYTSIAGILYDASRTRLVTYPEGRSGPYVIPDGVLEIAGEKLSNPHAGEGIGAFANCKRLTSITIPASVSSIASRALDGCSNLKAAIFLGDAPPDLYQRFDGSHADFTIRYLSTSTGFTSPTSHGYPAQLIDESTYPAARWLLSHDLPHDTDLHGENTGLFMAYALDLDPNKPLQTQLPSPVHTDEALSLTFRTPRPELTYTVETTTDLRSWTPTGVSLSAPSPDHTRTASAPHTGTPQRYLRLVVSD